MRKILLAGVAALSLVGMPARADLPVIDITSVGKLLQSIGIEGQQLEQMIATVQGILQVYQETQMVFNSVSELVHAEQWAQGLLSPSARNPLPFAASEHPGWVGGFNDPSSLPFGSQYLGQNTVGGNLSVYQHGDFVGGEFVKAIRSLSTMQALASGNVLSIENRIIALGNLFSRLASIGTIQETGSLQARLEAEANYAHAQKIQSQNLYAAAQQQLAVLEYNQRQWQYQDEQHGIAIMCQSLASSPNPYFLRECSGVSGSGS